MVTVHYYYNYVRQAGGSWFCTLSASVNDYYCVVWVHNQTHSLVFTAFNWVKIKLFKFLCTSKHTHNWVKMKLFKFLCTSKHTHTHTHTHAHTHTHTHTHVHTNTHTLQHKWFKLTNAHWNIYTGKSGEGDLHVQLNHHTVHRIKAELEYLYI